MELEPIVTDVKVWNIKIACGTNSPANFIFKLEHLEGRFLGIEVLDYVMTMSGVGGIGARCSTCTFPIAGRAGSNRRELGHGALAEKGLKHLVPPSFPFCVRLACQVSWCISRIELVIL